MGRERRIAFRLTRRGTDAGRFGERGGLPRALDDERLAVGRFDAVKHAVAEDFADPHGGRDRLAIGFVCIGKPNCFGPQSKNDRRVDPALQLRGGGIWHAQPNRAGDEIQVFIFSLDPAVQEVHRRRAEEAGDESVRRTIVNLQRRADLLQFARREHGDAVAQQQRVVLIVRDAERRRRPAAVDFQQIEANLFPQRAV